MEQLILSSLTVEQLKEIIVETCKQAFAVKEQIKQLTAKPVIKDQFLTRKETAAMLHVSLPTLNQWTKEGKLESYRLGTRILYKREEVTESVTRRNFTNCERKKS